MAETREATRPKPEADAESHRTVEAQGREAGDPIADALQTMFRSTEAEPLPDRFRDLLDRLAAEEEARP